ncbi:MAG: D-lactate dehydrogenase [Frankiaceae bacterium]|jgi:D-lactate dehydrogenase|nr:D-lactate dehydrogenase [Frankiaceae bacterium]MDQ1715874.1 D-lactate dehydrogenase [Frankiaceae bacterium]
MKTAVFSAKAYDAESLDEAADGRHNFTYFDVHLTAATARLAEGFDAVCAFVNDTLDAEVLGQLKAGGTTLVALRATGFNNVDVAAVRATGMTITRVPAYSPYAVAEHALTLMLSVNRHIPRAYQRVRDGNFSLAGLLGFDVHNKTVAVVGTGRIGAVMVRLLTGFGCEVLAYDVRHNAACEADGATYVDLPEIFGRADVISLHCPLMPETWHLINAETIASMKQGVVIINTSRGALVDTQAAIDGLKSGRIGALGLDVYEEEASLFFEDLSDTVIGDDTFSRLLTFPNVLITGHQAFFTREALAEIAATTIATLDAWEAGRPLPPEVVIVG